MPPERIDRIEHTAQWVVDLMGYTCRKPAHRRQLLRGYNLPLQALLLLKLIQHVTEAVPQFTDLIRAFTDGTVHLIQRLMPHFAEAFRQLCERPHRPFAQIPAKR